MSKCPMSAYDCAVCGYQCPDAEPTNLQLFYYRLRSTMPRLCPPGVTEADIRRAAKLFGVDVDAE